MSTYFIARQPILTQEGETYGYELLFRSSHSNAYDPSVDGNAATSTVLFNAIVEAGLNNLVGKGMAFVNLTNHFFENPELLGLLPPGRCVLEVLETVDVTDSVFEGVKKLRAEGHVIALDDFVDSEKYARLLPLADIIKYDITQHSVDELRQFHEQDKAAGRLSLAERVETHEEHETLSEIGFLYFQGYYFAKPKIMSGSKLPENRQSLLQLMAELNNPESTIDEIAEIVGRDVSLGVRTLRYVNSPMTGLTGTVTSIRQATVLLGRGMIRNWVTLLIMTEMDDMPSELIKLGLSRARFCQSLALEEGLDDGRYFTIGLLSLLDVYLHTTMDKALTHVGIEGDIRDELLERKGDGGRMLDLLDALEHGRIHKDAGALVEDVSIMHGRLFQDAALWAEQNLGFIADPPVKKCA